MLYNFEEIKKILSEKEESNILFKITNDINILGGKVFLVGGIVRDTLINKQNKDIDIEVHNITPAQLKEILSKYGEVDEIGESFGILKIHNIDIDFAMPRTEKKKGEGHKSFDVSVNPFMGTLEASRRRDITINSLMIDLVSGELVDHFNGITDLENGVIRHIDANTFIEDPLRVFRVCQFASRFNFKVDEETLSLCKNIDICSVSKERVYGELEKAILKSKNPSIFFKTLKQMNKLAPFFNDLQNIWESAFNSSMNAIDSLEDKNMFNVLAILGHSIIEYSILDNSLDNYSKYCSFINRFTNRTNLFKPVFSVIEAIRLQTESHTDSLIRKICFKTLDYSESFKIIIRAIYNSDKERISKFIEKYDCLIKEVETPIIKPDDLLKYGIKPSKEFGILLNKAMNLQINGEKDKDKILTNIIK